MWFLGALTFVRATAASTRGAFGLVEQLVPAGFASPFHVHHAEDEAFYIVEGELTFFLKARNQWRGQVDIFSARAAFRMAFEWKARCRQGFCC